MIFLCILLVYSENEQCVTNLQGKPQINLAYFKRIGFQYLSLSVELCVLGIGRIMDCIAPISDVSRRDGGAL